MELIDIDNDISVQCSQIIGALSGKCDSTLKYKGIDPEDIRDRFYNLYGATQLYPVDCNYQILKKIKIDQNNAIIFELYGETLDKINSEYLYSPSYYSMKYLVLFVQDSVFYNCTIYIDYTNIDCNYILNYGLYSAINEVSWIELFENNINLIVSILDKFNYLDILRHMKQQRVNV